MSRIRVLRVITRMNIGGPAIHAALLTARLDPHRYETLLVSGQEAAAEGNMLDLGRIQLDSPPRIVPSLGRAVSPLADLRALFEVIRIARAYRPDVVHTHLAKAGFVGRIAGRLSGARVVVHTYHGSVLRAYFGPVQSSLYVWIERLLGRLSSAVIALSARQRDELAELGVAPKEKIVEIPLGLDLSAFASAPPRGLARSIVGVPPDVPLVVLVARLVPVKDVGTLLEALVSLRAQVPGIRVLIVGDGSERARLEALAAELGVEDVCAFTGFRADVAAVYAAADVVALCSLNEGSPVSLIEAMSVGRPVVATAVGGVPDVVREGETGLLVPPRDPAALANALATLLHDPAQRARFGEAARVAARRFDADQLVSDIEHLYGSLLVESRR